MFKYVAAVATAVTLFVCSPVATAATDGTKAKVSAQVPSAPTAERVVVDPMPASVIVDGRKPYLLSQIEQKALGRALLRSVKFIDSLA